MTTEPTFPIHIILWILAISVAQADEILPLSRGETPPQHSITLTGGDNIPLLLRDIKSRWPGLRIDPRSRDFALLTYIQKDKALAKKAIPELIDLAGLLEPPLITTEPISKGRLSPAGCALVAIGDEAEPQIKAWLDSHDNASDARDVLTQALQTIQGVREWKLRKEKRKQDQARATQANEAANPPPSSLGLPPADTAESSSQRPAPLKALAQAQITPHVPAEESPSRAWLLWLFVVVAAITGLWLMVRKSSK